MDQRLPASSLSTSGEEGGLAWNASRLAQFERHRQLLQLSPRLEEEPYFVDYKPPARDAITLPRNVVYVLLGVVVVIMATYAIVGHLIKDLMHDVADCILGPKPRREEEDPQDEGEDRGERSSIEKYRLETIEEDEDEEEDERRILLWVEEEEEEEGLLQPPTPPPPLRSAIASCPAGEKRTSAHSVTFACPTLPYVTSL